MNKAFRNFDIAITFGLILFLSIFLYFQGLSGVFLVDDGVHLAALNALGGVVDWNSAKHFIFSGDASALGRPISMASFLIDDQYYPGDVAQYRYTNVMIHVLCGVLLFVLVRLIIGVCESSVSKRYRDVLALIVMAWWLLSPLNVSTTLYVIQRMTQLSALFTVMGLLGYVFGRGMLGPGRLFKGRCFAITSLYSCVLLAILSKENGVLLFPLALAVEFVVSLCNKEKPDKFLLAAIVVPIGIGAIYFLFSFDGFTSSKGRAFTTYERFCTEMRILWMYLFKVIVPIRSKMGLMHDDIVLSRGLLSPFSTLLSVCGHMLLLAIATIFRRRSPLIFLGVFGFYISHVLESTIIPLELYFEHRNYVPSMFVYLALVGVLILVPDIYRKQISCLYVGIILLSSVVTYQRSVLWAQPFEQAMTWAVEHPNSIRAQTMFSKVLVKSGNNAWANKVLEEAEGKWPDALHLNLFRINQYCAGNVPLKRALSKISDLPWLFEYDGTLPSEIDNLFGRYKAGGCDVLTDDFMLYILQNAKNVKYAKRKFKANVAFMEFEFHSRIGNLGGALSALDESYKHSRSPRVIFVKAGVFYSAGLISEAKKAIDLAIKLEEDKPEFLRNDLSSYFQLRSRLERGVAPGS